MKLLVSVEGTALKLIVPVADSDAGTMSVRELRGVVASRWGKRDHCARPVAELRLSGFALDDDDLVSAVLSDCDAIDAIPASSAVPAPSSPTAVAVAAAAALAPAAGEAPSFADVVVFVPGSSKPRVLRLPAIKVNGGSALRDVRELVSGMLGFDAAQQQRAVLLYTAKHPLVMDPATEARVTLADVCVEEHDTLFAAVRPARSSSAAAAAAASAASAGAGWIGTYALSQWWQPSQWQTDTAICKFLAVLYVVVSHISSLSTQQQGRILGFLRKATRFAPLVSALYCLTKRLSIADPEKAAIAEGLYNLFRWIVPADVARDDAVFEHSDTCWAFVLEEGAKSDDLEKNEVFRAVSVTCPLSFARLEDPVRFPKSPEAVSREAARKALAEGQQMPGYSESEQRPSIAEAVRDRELYGMLLCNPTKTSDVYFWNVSRADAAKVMAECQPPQIICDWRAMQHKRSSYPCLTLFVGVAMKSATSPALCLYEDGHTCVYSGRSKDVNLSYIILHPLKGEAINVNPDVLATKVAKLGISGAAVPERTDTRKPEEAIVVLLDVSGSMNSVFHARGTSMSRIEAVKHLFHAFSNRSMAYNYPHHIGLILFGSNVQIACPLTPLFETFKSTVDAAFANGMTALHEALGAACELLRAFHEKNRTCSLRVLCLTDGNDTASRTPAYKVCGRLQALGVRVDAFIIGGEDSASLRAISVATGGLCFHPETLIEGMRLFEVEAVLALKERGPSQAKPLVGEPSDLERFGVLLQYPYSVSPQRPPPALISRPVATGGTILRQAAAHRPPGIEAGKAAPPGMERTRRILKELQQLCVTRPHPAVHVFPCSENIGFWRILLVGPQSTPYADGIFLLYANFGESYPSTPPEIRAVTPIHHVNINSAGKICHSVLDRNWTADTSMFTVFSCIYGLFLAPEPEDPLDSILAEECLTNRAAYDAKAREMTLSQAGKSLQQWRAELKVEDDEPASPAAAAAAASAAEASVPPPSHLIDPITHALFVDPVITRSGHTYERAAIQKWIAEHGTDPTTRQPLNTNDLAPNIAIRTAAEDFRKSTQAQTAAWWN